MRRLLPIVLLAVAAPLCHAAEQVREVPEFKSINSKGAFKLVVEVGPKQSLLLKGEDQALAGVTTEVVGGELVLNMKDREGRKGFHSDDGVRVTITVPQLRQFQMEGAGMTELNNVTGERFELVYRGAGMLGVNGKVRTFVLRAQGVGLLDAKHLSAQQVDAVLEGVGSTSVRASDVLNATVNGIGSLTYYGRPAKINKTVGGIGSVSAGD
jgi:hypothetical protein